jgi:hypothetical protein
MLHYLAGILLSATAAPQQSQELTDQVYRLVRKGYELTGEARREVVRELESLGHELVLYEFIRYLDTEKDIETGEEIERAFLSLNRRLRSTRKNYGQENARSLAYGTRLAEAYLSPKAIPSEERKSLIRKQLPFLPKDVAGDPQTVTVDFPVCGTGRPNRDPFANLSALEPAFVRSLLLAGGRKGVLLMYYYMADKEGAQALLPQLARDPNSTVRADAAFYMRIDKQFHDLSLIRDLSMDPAADVRYRALEILVNLDTSFSKPLITALLKDKVAAVRQAAEMAVAMMQPPP